MVGDQPGQYTTRMVREGPRRRPLHLATQHRSGAPPNPRTHQPATRHPPADSTNTSNRYATKSTDPTRSPAIPPHACTCVRSSTCVTPHPSNSQSPQHFSIMRSGLRAEGAPALRGSSLTLLAPQGADRRPTLLTHQGADRRPTLLAPQGARVGSLLSDQGADRRPTLLAPQGAKMEVAQPFRVRRRLRRGYVQTQVEHGDRVRQRTDGQVVDARTA